MGKTDKSIKYKRTVILLKYKDKTESLILSKTVKRRKENVTIKVACNTKIRKSVNKYKLKEKYPIFKAQLKERIVPCCLRAKCAEKMKYRGIHQQQQQRNAKKGPKHQIERKRSISLSTISSMEIDNELNNSFIYENNNSDSLSSYTDDEIETLMKSTRKRMNDSNDDWKLFPKQQPSSPSISDKSANVHLSLNSLDTIKLDADDSKEYLETYDLKNEAYSPTMNSEELISWPFLSNNNEEFIHNSYIHFKDTEFVYEDASYHKIDDTIIKLEPNYVENKYSSCHTTININNNSIKQELYGDL